MKRYVFALALLIAGLAFTAPEAQAQSHSRSGISVGSGRGGFHVEIWSGRDHGGWGHRGPVYRHPYPRGPVYYPAPPRRGCDPYYDDCYGRGGYGRGAYDYDRPAATIVVTIEEPYRDRYGYICYETRRVTAYWDHVYGGYYYINRYGDRVYVR